MFFKSLKSARIHISIAFGDAILPVVECEDGHQRVPLKPIADQIGINWSTQRNKIKSNEYINRRLGVNLVPLKGHQNDQNESVKPQYCIRIDRVTAYLNTINPENVRSMGNHEAADWLEAKHDEWDDALHDYEIAGFAVNKTHHSNQNKRWKTYRQMAATIMNKNKTEDASDRKLLTCAIKEMADELNIPYQVDVFDDSKAS